MAALRDRISLAFCEEDFREAEKLCNEWILQARREGNAALLAEALASLANAVESRGLEDQYLRDLSTLVGKDACRI